MALENVKRLVTNVASTTVKKAGEQVKITRLELSKNSVEKEIESLYAEIGRCCYAKVKSGEQLGESVAAYCAEIDELARRIARIENEISAHKLERDGAEYRFDTAAAESSVEIPIEDIHAAPPADAAEWRETLADDAAETAPAQPESAPDADGPHPGAPAEDPVHAPEGPASAD